MNASFAISVVIPAFNAGPYLRRSIGSVLAQTFKPAEILVIDDGSTDDTAAIGEHYGDSIKYVYQNNAGAPAARNAGIHFARGEWIALLDADDEWRPHHLSNAVSVLQKHPELKWYGASVNHYLHQTGRLVKKYVKKKHGILLGNAYFDDYMVAFPPYAHFSCPTMVIHRSVFESVGVFDSRKKTGEDLDMWFRIGLHYPQVGYCHEVAANVYKRCDSLSRTKKWDYQAALSRFRDAEVLAEEVGHDARRRAEPRIMYWATKLVKAGISHGDCQAVRELLVEYDKRLAPRWRWLARAFLVAPWAFKPAFALRNSVSPKQRELRKGDSR